jgi:hypothetical protein
LGRAFVAGRCRGGAELVDAITGRELVCAGGGAVVDLVEVLEVVVGVLGAVTRATGAGSGPILDGALTGARSGPAPRATAGTTARPEVASTATKAIRANRSR